jgi:hypothetical protein
VLGIVAPLKLRRREARQRLLTRLWRLGRHR